MHKELEKIIKDSMTAQSLSLRKLSALCKISPSTLSRILTGKQQANTSHLQAISEQLHIPLGHLLKAYGLEITEHNDETSKVILSVIYDILESFEIEYENLVFDIKKELKKFEQYAKATAGRELIEEVFNDELNALKAEGYVIDQLQKLYSLYCSDEAQLSARSVAGSALLYLISTPDVIPDYAFPVGFLDDAIAISLTIERLKNEHNILLS